MINHSQHYVDPNDATLHTNTIEGVWTQVKGKFKRMSGTRKNGPLLDTYLQEFSWRRLYGDAAFHHIVNDIAQLYPV